MTERATALQPGAHVGGLQINAVLGSGAWGVTYLATDPAIGTRFALKEYFPAAHAERLPGGGVQPLDEGSTGAFADGLQTFLGEARVVAALDHPNIARVLRYFEANGTAYLLMPFYAGEALHEALESGGVLNRERAKALLLPLMDALEYIHERGIVHRDIKPANILLKENGEPLLLDFGVAATAGPLLGSEGYAAPEQYTHKGEIGPWTDIYALAATLYRCVTGKIPAPAAARLEARKRDEPDPLVPFSELAPAGLYGGLTDAVELGLKLSAGERPASIGAWRKAFKSLDWHRSVVLRGAGEGYEQERREWLPVTLLVVFLLAMTGVGIFLLTDETPRQPQSASGADVAAPPPVAVNAPPPKPSSEETLRWQAALKADTVSAYRDFLEAFPESIHAPQARTQLDVLDEKSWLELSAEDSVPAYRDYLEVFPLGIHQAEAMQRIEAIEQAEARRERERQEREKQEQLAWDEASDERSIAAFDRYIGAWPAGAHIEEARRLRRLLADEANDDQAFGTAMKLATKDALQAYIDAFPQGAHVAEALEQMDRLTLRPGKDFRDCAQCPAMTVVPAGAYWQGADESSELALGIEKPRRLVTIGRPFAVGVHEVTMTEWDACFADGGCSSSPADNGWGRGRRPVIMVSWNDAEEYVHWISEKTGQVYRLPSESEWEYFARAGEESDWPGGDPASVCNYGNIAGAETGFRWQHPHCGDELALGTAPAGSFKANAFGLHDTTGNVSEWTADCLNLSYLDAPVDGSAWGRGICSSHMTRGGSWITGSRDIRLPARFNLKNGDRNDFTGFRVVREIED